MRPKSTTLDLPSSHDVKVYLHNQFIKHMTNLKEEIMVSDHLMWTFNSQHTFEDGSRKGLDNRRRVVGGYDKDGVYGNDGPLDRGEGEEVDVEGRGNRVQGIIRRA